MKNSNLQTLAKQGIRTSGKFSINSAQAQIMINERIAREEQEEQKAYWEAKPYRHAYFIERLEGLISRTIHHLNLYRADTKNSINRENLTSIQWELTILLKAMPHWVEQYGLTQAHIDILTEKP